MAIEPAELEEILSYVREDGEVVIVVEGRQTRLVATQIIGYEVKGDVLTIKMKGEERNG